MFLNKTCCSSSPELHRFTQPVIAACDCSGKPGSLKAKTLRSWSQCLLFPESTFQKKEPEEAGLLMSVFCLYPVRPLTHCTSVGRVSSAGTKRMVWQNTFSGKGMQNISFPDEAIFKNGDQNLF